MQHQHHTAAEAALAVGAVLDRAVVVAAVQAAAVDLEAVVDLVILILTIRNIGDLKRPGYKP